MISILLTLAIFASSFGIAMGERAEYVQYLQGEVGFI